jgi:hypothetical protein
VDGRQLITTRVPLEEIVEEGFKVLEDSADVLKILITPHFESTRRHQRA